MFSFVSNFKNPTFAWLLSLGFSRKASWCIPVTIKFESYNLLHCKKKCCKLIFCVLPEQLLSHIIFGQLQLYEVTLVKRYNKPLLKKVKQKCSYKKDFIKNLFKVNEKKNSAVLRLNQIMFKLLTMSKCLQLNC